jgi:hypothetical protein
MEEMSFRQWFYFVGVISACIAAAWKVFHELYVKPKDMRIDLLKDDMARLNRELDLLKKVPTEPLSILTARPATVSALPLMQPLPDALPIAKAEALPATAPPQSGAQTDPSSSLAACIAEWENEALTNLQRKDFEKRWTGKHVKWIAAVDSVEAASSNWIYVRVTENIRDYFNPKAVLIFPSSRAAELVSLSKGQHVVVEGTIHEFFLHPTLQEPRIERLNAN